MTNKQPPDQGDLLAFRQLQQQQTAKLKTTVSIDRLTFAVNDDHLSQLNQTEILRVTLDNALVEFELGMKSMNMNASIAHLQLDNQMFDLDAIDDSEFNKVAHKYDFPVIFMPRAENKLSSKQQHQQKKSITSGVGLSGESSGAQRNYFQTLDFFRSSSETAPNSSTFLRVKLKFCTPDSSSVPFRLVQLDLDIKPFDVYLEDYLIYNLAEIGLEFFELASSGRRVDGGDQSLATTLRARELKSYRFHDLDLNVIGQPLLTVSQMRISPIDALVSLQTSIKIYLASYKMPIVFDEFSLKGLPLVVQSSPQIVKQLTNHYLTSLLFRAGWLLGSLELIGSPTAFLQQVCFLPYFFFFT